MYATHADGAGVYVDAVRLHENGVTYGNVERSGASATAENEKPSLAVRSQAPTWVSRPTLDIVYLTGRSGP